MLNPFTEEWKTFDHLNKDRSITYCFLKTPIRCNSGDHTVGGKIQSMIFGMRGHARLSRCSAFFVLQHSNVGCSVNVYYVNRTPKLPDGTDVANGHDDTSCEGVMGFGGKRGIEEAMDMWDQWMYL
jgi:hypothetical protein